MCFGKLLEAGWGVDAGQQSLIHNAGVRVPIELQNKSMTVKGWVRVLGDASDNCPKDVHGDPSSGSGGVDEALNACFSSVRTVKADVPLDLERGPVGWTLDEHGIGIGRHYSDHFQDPTLVRPSMDGAKFRTTLIKDSGDWLVLKLCEPLEGLIDLSAGFYDIDGSRNVLTIITDSEKPPMLMGFTLCSEYRDEPRGDPQLDKANIHIEDLAPQGEDIQGIDIEVEVQGQQGVEIVDDRIVIAPAPTDSVLVNGAELTAASTLASLRAGLNFYGLSTSGSKAKCFQKLLNHQKKLELDNVKAAAEAAEKDMQRDPIAPRLAVPPSARETCIDPSAICTMV